jgi:hypothetical protein
MATFTVCTYSVSNHQPHCQLLTSDDTGPAACCAALQDGVVVRYIGSAAASMSCVGGLPAECQAAAEYVELVFHEERAQQWLIDHGIHDEAGMTVWTCSCITIQCHQQWPLPCGLLDAAWQCVCYLLRCGEAGLAARPTQKATSGLRSTYVGIESVLALVRVVGACSWGCTAIGPCCCWRLLAMAAAVGAQWCSKSCAGAGSAGGC